MPYKSVHEALFNLTVPICLCVLFAFIIINFLMYDDEASVDQLKKSPIETFSMTGFVGVLYCLVIFKIGVYPINAFTRIIAYLGILVFIFATLFNIIGRFYLGKNWSNQVRLKTDHTLITTGPYKIVRHPLYASIIWMIYASGFIYHNYSILILNTFLFIPLMVLRAKQEERVLKSKFESYDHFIKNTGLFFPRLGRFK